MVGCHSPNSNLYFAVIIKVSNWARHVILGQLKTKPWLSCVSFDRQAPISDLRSGQKRPQTENKMVSFSPSPCWFFNIFCLNWWRNAQLFSEWWLILIKFVVKIHYCAKQSNWNQVDKISFFIFPCDDTLHPLHLNLSCRSFFFYPPLVRS